jgi:subtilisin family serine protease
MDPRLQLLQREAADDAEVGAIIRLKDPTVAPPGVRVVSQFGDIATVRLLSQDITDVRAHEATESLKAAELLWNEEAELVDSELADVIATGPDGGPADHARPHNEPATGRGVVVGLADWGCDFAHPSFRREDGSTRMLALWDQRDLPGRAPNNQYGYGYVHDRDAIDRALRTDQPYAILNYHPADAEPAGESGSHGTHTMHIAAGGPLAGGPSGIAPEAEIVFVHLAGGPAPLATLGTSVNLLEAVDFIFRTAGERPCVINLSLGQQAGAHDGTSPVERGLDAALLAAPGRLICQSCGNYYNRRIHAAGELRPGQQRTLRIEVGETSLIPNEVDLWYSREDSIRISAQAPDGTRTPWLTTGDQAGLQSQGSQIGRLYVRANDPNNGNHHAALFIFPGAPPGIWELSLMGEDVVDGRFNLWLERNSVARGSQPRFVHEDAIELSTTGTICNGYRTIAVAAYDAHTDDRSLASFSSRGPTADGRWKPDIAAPGVSVLAARSAPRDSAAPSLLTRKSGTSMASPHVAGTAALVYEIAGPLPIQDMRRLMLGSAERAQGTDGSDEMVLGIGSGYLDIAGTTAAARALASRRRGWSKRAAETAPQPKFLNEQEIAMEDFVGTTETTDLADGRTSDEMPSFFEDVEVVRQPVSQRAAPTEDVGLRVVRAAEAISSRGVQGHPGELIGAVLGEATRPPFPAELFDAIVLGRAPIHPLLASSFEVVAAPGHPIAGLRSGDLAITRRLAEPDPGVVRVVGGSLGLGWAASEGATVPADTLIVRPLRLGLELPVETVSLADWEHLISLRPSTSVQLGLKARGTRSQWVTHHIEDAWGNVNLDFYPVQVTRLPSSYSRAEDLLHYMRANFNRFVDTTIADFSPLDARIDGPGWATDPPVLGSVIHIRLKMAWGYANPDDGSVVVSESAPDHWTFSTCWTEPDLAHPVSGNRQFGFTTDNGWTFYTRGSDRTTQLVDYTLSYKVFGAADLLWRSLQKGIADFVNASGGSATVLTPYSARHDWPSVRTAYWHPTVSWV